MLSNLESTGCSIVNVVFFLLESDFVALCTKYCLKIKSTLSFSMTKVD